MRRREVCNFIKAMAHDRKCLFAKARDLKARDLAHRTNSRNLTGKYLRRYFEIFRKGRALCDYSTR